MHAVTCPSHVKHCGYLFSGTELICDGCFHYLGGTIAGKAVTENFCFSACSSTASTGTVTNPHNPIHSAGGSSSGSAALVSQGASFLSVMCVCLFIICYNWVMASAHGIIDFEYRFSSLFLPYCG